MTAVWDLIAKFQWNVFLDRVPTDSNISDGMSRLDRDQARELDWELVEDVDLDRLTGLESELRKGLAIDGRLQLPARAGAAKTSPEPRKGAKRATTGKLGRESKRKRQKRDR